MLKMGKWTIFGTKIKAFKRFSKSIYQVPLKLFSDDRHDKESKSDFRILKKKHIMLKLDQVKESEIHFDLVLTKNFCTHFSILKDLFYTF